MTLPLGSSLRQSGLTISSQSEHLANSITSGMVIPPYYPMCISVSRAISSGVFNASRYAPSCSIYLSFLGSNCIGVFESTGDKEALNIKRLILLFEYLAQHISRPAYCNHAFI